MVAGRAAGAGAARQVAVENAKMVRWAAAEASKSERTLLILLAQALEHALAHSGLSEEKPGVVRSVASSGHAVENIEAAAGSGNTTSAATIATVYRDSGYAILDVCPTGRAARAGRARHPRPHYPPPNPPPRP